MLPSAHCKVARATVAVALACAAASASASARDLTKTEMYKGPTAVVAHSAGFYVWADGSYQSIGLPSFDLGWRVADFATSFDRGPAVTHNVRLAGAGASGGIGYVFPHGTFPAALGANARIEIGGSYVRAEATQAESSPSVVLGSSGMGFRLTSVDGALLTGFGCPAGCFVRSTVETSYEARRLDVRAASDVITGRLTLAPSLGIIVGQARVHQDASMRMNFNQYLYDASTTLDWTDWGAKLGLDATMAVTPLIALGLGGSAGYVRRNVVFSATDRFTPNPGFFSFFGRVTEDAAVTPLLANAEARLMITPWRTTAIRAFAGLNHDNRVPGVAPPCPANSCIAPAFVGPPASIKFGAETSYYAGGGLTIDFRP